MEVHKKVHETFKNRRSSSPSKKMCVVDKIEPKNYSQAEQAQTKFLEENKQYASQSGPVFPKNQSVSTIGRKTSNKADD